LAARLRFAYAIYSILEISSIVYTPCTWHTLIMPRAEEFPVKFQFAITREMNAAIADWRRQQADLPNRSEAIRRLVQRGLVADHTDVQVESRAAVLKRALSSEPEAAKPRRRAKQKSQ
jgi:hypothetical protein